MVTMTVSRSLIGGCCPDVGEDTWTSQDGRKLDSFPLHKHKHLLSVLVCSSVDHILKALIKSCRL